MRIPLLLTILTTFATGATGCSSEPYEMAPGETRTFLVEGPDPHVDQETGEVSVTGSHAISPELTLLTLECSPSGPCTGTVRGC